jgi:hypothetical protein
MRRPASTPAVVFPSLRFEMTRRWASGRDPRYEGQHRSDRSRLVPVVSGGFVRCVRGLYCKYAEEVEGVLVGGLIHPGEAWDLGHADVESPGGPEHAVYNRSAGGSVGEREARKPEQALAGLVTGLSPAPASSHLRRPGRPLERVRSSTQPRIGSAPSLDRGLAWGRTCGFGRTLGACSFASSAGRRTLSARSSALTAQRL